MLFIDFCKKLLEILVGWIWFEIVVIVDVWLELDFEVRCEGICLLNDFCCFYNYFIYLRVIFYFFDYLKN